MIEDIKITAFICMAAVISAVIRFKTLARAIIDSLLGFLMGSSSYLLLGLWFEDGTVRAGFVGMIILMCRPLYDWADNFIRHGLTKIINQKMGRHK